MRGGRSRLLMPSQMRAAGSNRSVGCLIIMRERKERGGGGVDLKIKTMRCCMYSVCSW